jgi:hypothetical protein
MSIDERLLRIGVFVAELNGATVVASVFPSKNASRSQFHSPISIRPGLYLPEKQACVGLK